MTVHPHTAAFDAAAADYELGRPGYPDSLLEWLARGGHLERGDTVIDLGAGTGKLTRLLVRSPARVIAAEPIPGMREEFKRVLPETEIFDAAAESLPFEDASVQMVTCGQSFRWFANHDALGEIARVLTDDGELVLVSNSYDKANPVQRRMQEAQDAAAGETEEDKPGADWEEVLSESPYFAPVEEIVLRNEVFVDRAALPARLRSSSQFARLAPSRQAELLARVEEVLEGDRVDLTQFTTATRLRRLGRA